MHRPFEIILPEADDELREELERELGAEAQVYEPPADYSDLEQIKLILEVIVLAKGAVDVSVEVAKVLGKLRDIVQRRTQAKRLRIKVLDGGKDIALADATDEQIRKLAEESRGEHG